MGGRYVDLARLVNFISNFKFYLYLLVRQVRAIFKQSIHGLKNCHSTFLIKGKTSIARDLKAGMHGYVGPGCIITSNVELGNFVMLGPNVSIVGNDHRFDLPNLPIIFSGRPSPVVTKVGNDVWIGAGAILLAGIEIGDGCIVAAGSVVVKDCKEYSIYAGNPAKKVRDRFSCKDDIELHKGLLLAGVFPANYTKNKMSLSSKY